jgi:pilus assembly protein Flp/PilA
MISNFKNIAMNLLNDESGQDLIEYALIAAVLALGAFTVMPALATKINSTFTSVTTAL